MGGNEPIDALMNDNLKILLVEDLDSDEELLIRYLKKQNIVFTHIRVWLKDDYIKALDEFNPDLIISDHSLPQFNGMEAFRILKSQKRKIPFILITGTVSEKLLTEYMFEGIDDYILKENLLRLPSCMENVLNKKKIEILLEELSISNEELKVAHTVSEVFKKEILESMRYAHSLQKALLQEKEELQEVLPQSFILYLPKQIVSGDFYWFKNLEEKVYVCVGDCTGHGIPGALITMMALTTLHSAFNFQNMYSPHTLLKFLDEDMYRKFSHKSKGKVMNDSVDLVICEIDRINMMLTFSGANGKMYLIRNDEIQEFVSDKYNIGNAVPEKVFESQKIPLKKGDTIYLTSDGFCDQFGGEVGKKFTSKRFRELLLAINNEPFGQYENILRKTITDWQENEEQTDDISVMGVRV